MFVCALLSAMLIQIGTNLVNDAMDFVKGADTEKRIGPRRITAAGVLSARTTLLLATAVFLGAMIAGLPLVMKGGTVIVLIGLVSILMGYAYTAGPFPLAYVGLGDLFVILFFGLVAVGGMYYLHSLQFHFDTLWLGLQIGFHATVLIAINNFRDCRTDGAVGKKTLAVRFGESFARKEIVTLIFAPFVMNLWWLERGLWIAAALPWLALPLAIKVARKIAGAEPSPELNRALAMSAGLQMLFGFLLSIGFVLS